MPVWTMDRQHIFCGKYFLTAMRESGIHCPLCRGSVTRRERACPERALDLENIMRRFSGSCRCCSKKVGLYYVIVLIFLVNMALRRKTFPGCYVKHL